MIIFTTKDCPKDATAVLRKKGTVLLAYIRKVHSCAQCDGPCWQLQEVSGRITHHEKKSEAREDALKL